MNDAEIVELYLARDEEALKQTAEKYGARLQALALSILEDMPAAEECVNDAYLTAWNSIPPHTPRDYLFAYLARITRHISLDRCRMRGREKRSAHLEARLDAKELAGAVSAWLRTLPEEKRILFLRRYWYGDGVSALAEHMGWGESRVKTALHRLRRALREHLEREGYL